MRRCWFCARESHADRVAPHDHGFKRGQRKQYDALTWRGRDAYDHFRWYVTGIDHDRALAMAEAGWGTKPKPPTCSHCRATFASKDEHYDHLIHVERYPAEDAGNAAYVDH